jgi:hypothetical protein
MLTALGSTCHSKFCKMNALLECRHTSLVPVLFNFKLLYEDSHGLCVFDRPMLVVPSGMPIKLRSNYMGLILHASVLCKRVDH